MLYETAAASRWVARGKEDGVLEWGVSLAPVQKFNPAEPERRLTTHHPAFRDGKGGHRIS